MNTNALTSTGVKFVFWVADYFAFMNNKMGGKRTRTHAVLLLPVLARSSLRDCLWFQVTWRRSRTAAST